MSGEPQSPKPIFDRLTEDERARLHQAKPAAAARPSSSLLWWLIAAAAAVLFLWTALHTGF